jgi:putative membrane protein
MKAGVVILALSMMLMQCRPPQELEEDSVIMAQERNEAASVDEDLSDFMTEAANSRMMGIEEGKLAKERGTTAEIKKYGKWMVEDQTIILKELKALAKSKKVVLPQKISDDRADGLATLQSKTQKDFDEKFVKMMTIDHRRDVRKFKNATTIGDKDVAAFASKYLPVIESHLQRAQEIKAESNRSPANM